MAKVVKNTHVDNLFILFLGLILGYILSTYFFNHSLGWLLVLATFLFGVIFSLKIYPHLNKTMQQSVTSYWVPALITALIGGTVVGFVVPKIQTHYTSIVAKQEYRISLWERFGKAFVSYSEARSKLIDIEKNRVKIIAEGNTNDLKELNRDKILILQDREKAEDTLLLDIELSQFYFKQSYLLMEAFLKWHQENDEKTINSPTLPTKADYALWQARIMESMYGELG